LLHRLQHPQQEYAHQPQAIAMVTAGAGKTDNPAWYSKTSTVWLAQFAVSQTLKRKTSGSYHSIEL